MTGVTGRLGDRLRAWLPAGLRARVPVSLKARARAVLGIDPWPDLAVHHPIFRGSGYRELRAQARPFDVRRPHKPVLERGHQASYLVARWFAAAGVQTAFHIGYASGRYLFYLSRAGIASGGTDLPAQDTAWAELPPGALDERTRRRLLQVDFLCLTAAEVAEAWRADSVLPLDVFFSEATFETMLPWRETGTSVQKYAGLDAAERRELLHERLPAKLAELAPCFRSLLLIEPEPAAGGAGEVFERCAARLAPLAFSVWRFRPPFDQLFRLSPASPVRQVVYVYAGDPAVTAPLREYAEPA